MKIALATNAGGGQLRTCLGMEPFRRMISAVVTDRHGVNSDLAESHGISAGVVDAEGSEAFNEALFEWAEGSGIDTIISFGFTRLFSGAFLRKFSGRVYNSHFSLLPAFPGKRGSDWTTEEFPPREIFARALAYGVRFTGNTIHCVDESIDGGTPVIQSVLPIPYDLDRRRLRHDLFIQECKCLFQFVAWLKQERIVHEGRNVRVAEADFDAGHFSPALEEDWIESFTLPVPE